ncbi:unnamed protein product [Triticum turgidum subsp. durum]|uniref:Magnesium transporter n=1 Tax=Triticum turgidum subsp. durum TaxID=4567 RepID=A0A9R1C312_TRITD|nr:unnamed protein product [Triticum turgidum subsp. durum]
MASWMYRSAIYLLTCVLFRLICHLQGLRLEDFAGSLLVEVEEGRMGVERVLREHLDIRKQLKVISHRFRRFIVAALLIGTASQFASVLLTTRHDSIDDLLHTGELALCSVVLMSGLIIILSSAAKITHQAQALTGQTTKWHACCTIEPVPDDEINPGSNQNSMLEEYPEDESDCESSEETGDEDMLENTKFLQPHTHVISFQKRQALGTYDHLQSPYISSNFHEMIFGADEKGSCSDVPGEQQGRHHRVRVHAGPVVPPHHIHARVDALPVAAGENCRLLMNAKECHRPSQPGGSIPFHIFLLSPV